MQYEYLIHSILALAASHLDAVSNANVAEEALSHRILAVKALNDALSVPPKTRNESDARMAAALALSFQSSHLQDGLLDFLTMVRGCNLIALGGNTIDSAFHVSSFPCAMRHLVELKFVCKLTSIGVPGRWASRDNADSPVCVAAEIGGPRRLGSRRFVDSRHPEA